MLVEAFLFRLILIIAIIVNAKSQLNKYDNQEITVGDKLITITRVQTVREKKNRGNNTKTNYLAAKYDTVEWHYKLEHDFRYSVILTISGSVTLLAMRGRGTQLPQNK